MEILFHTLKGTFPPVFTNTVIASLPQAPATWQLIRLLQQRYEQEYELGGDLTSPVQLTAEGAQQVRKLHDLQDQLEHRQSRFAWRDRKRKRRIQEEIHKLHLHRMEDKTDSRIINYWVEYLERITYTPPTLQQHIAAGRIPGRIPEGAESAPSDQHAAADFDATTIPTELPPPTPLEEGGLGVHPHEFLVSGSGFVNTEAMHYMYSFEKQTGVDIVATTDDDFVLL